MPKSKTASLGSGSKQTLLDHLLELQGRFFKIALIFICMTAAIYPFFDKIVNFILDPLGKEYELVYLTPGGAFTFIIMVCLYAGLILTLPAIIYHVYRFIMPVVNKVTMRAALAYVVTSFSLAIAGILFAYYVSLPASLYFLTSFDLYHINPMLTIDSYLSFVMTYLLVGAALFQIPLVMSIINRVKPMQPKKLMKHQDKIILGSFIIAAIVSPTPDALNQTLLASPMIVMYQIGVIAVWSHNRKVRKKSQKAARLAEVRRLEKAQPALKPVVDSGPTPMLSINELHYESDKESVVINTPRVKSRPTRSIDGVMRRSQPAIVRRPASLQRQLIASTRTMPVERTVRPRPSTARTVDGFAIVTQS